jgi:toxin ParE1/3/4
MNIIIRPDAAADLHEAFLWYENRRAGLGEELLLEIESALENIRIGYARYPVIHRDTRRTLVKRFPFCVFFRVYEETIVVIACLHAKRSPRTWRERMS